MPDSNAESRAGARTALTKISGIFGRAQKPKWIQDFHILLSHSDPNRRYRAGDVVRGEVHIKPTKPVRVTHITVALYGYTQVFKHFNAPGDGVSKEASQLDPARLLTSPGIVKLFNPVERTLHGECKLPNRLLRFQFAIPLPSHRLPTSIDFERGTIAYQLVATITRPTTIGPVLRCDPRKLYVNEDIDIALIPSPKCRVVTLEPIDKSRGKKSKKSGSRNNSNGTSSSDRPESSASSRSGSRASFTHSDSASVSNGSASTEFRVHCNHSNASSRENGHSIAGGLNGAGGGGGGGGGGSNRNSRTGMPPNSSKLVYASAEVQRGGFLPGDKIPIKIMVSHTKPIKSMCGVIITLYRKTHIDTQPVVHKAELDENGRTSVKLVAPDIYEKSLTGLGGLSLSNSGTSSTFRMDLTQTHLPLIINPQTLQAEITTHLEIPLEGVTPTITKVRGQSIDFRYFVEVCLDLQGKLESSRFLPRLTAQPLYGFGKPSAGNGAAVPLNLAAQGNHLIDTQLIRRERPSLVAWQFHVVVGTKDSQRAARKRQRDGWQTGDGPIALPPNGSNGDSRNAEGLADVEEEWIPHETVDMTDPNGHHTFTHNPFEGDRANEVDEIAGDDAYWNESSHDLSAPPSPGTTMPPPLPNLPMPEEPLSEKERLRMYEERLLPSAPPMNGAASSNAAAPSAPSAPPAELVDGFDTREAGGYSNPASFSRPRLHSRPSQASHLTCVEENAESVRSGVSASWSQGSQHHNHRHGSAEGQPQPMFRSVSSRGPASSGGQHGRSNGSSVAMSRSATDPTDDKQELERRRLMAERSAPLYDEAEDAASASVSAGASSSHQASAPSAPALGELVEGVEEQHAAFGEWDPSHDELPRYEQ